MVFPRPGIVKDSLVGEMVRLTVVPDEGEAVTLCGLLRTEGIACDYRDTDPSAAGIFGGTTFGGWREILVDEDDLDRARELLPHPQL
jgi:hypothetical protein